MNKHKLVSSALAIATLVVMVGAPLVNASAQTTSSLQAQIAALLAQIQTLQSQLNASGSTSTGATYNFTSDLTVGSTGSQVMALQQFLIAKGDLVLATPTTYFGALTQAALAKFQAANGITPSVGYFGPKTRAFVNSMSTGTGTGTGTGTTVVVPTGAPLSVALDPQTPGATNVANGAVNTPVLKLDFTAGTSPVTVTNLVLNRTGLSQDTDLDNVYIYNGATKLASNLGFNNGAITFSNGAGLFTVPANTTYQVTVTVDIDKSTSTTGHIFQIGLASAANVTGGTFSGNFPLTSSQFTIATVSNLATLTVSGVQGGSTSVNAGQLNDLVAQMTVQAGNNPVKVTHVNFTNVGSVTPSYLQNVKLMDGSAQLGATISSLGSNNIATFDLSGAPLMLTSGQSVVLSLYADITGGVNRNFQFSIQQSSDVQAVDTNYGVGIGASLPTGTSFPINFSQVTINNGGVVASKDAATPTTYAVAGNTNQVFAKFDVLASGDSIKFNELDFNVAMNNGSVVNNFRVVDDQGAQIGSTANPVNITATGSTTVAEGSGSLNYIVPANTTRVLTVYGDLPSSASGTIQVTLNGSNPSGNTSAQSYSTYASATTSAVSANTLTILASSTNLLVSRNYGLGSPVSAPAGGSQVRIGSYTLTAGQVNGVNLTGVTILATTSLQANYITNLSVFDGSTQVGQTYAQVSGGSSYNFNSAAPIAIPANGSVTLDVFANISSGVTTSSTVTSVTTLSNVNASTQAGNAIAVASTYGQNVTFNAGGALNGSLSAGTSQASQLGMSVGGVNVAQYQFVADNNGGETLTKLTVFDDSTTTATTTPGNSSDLVNYRLTDTAGNVLSTASENSSGYLIFNLTGLAIPVNGTQYVNLVADTNSYPYAISGGTHAYDLQSYQYTNASVATTTNVSRANGMGNLFTVYQTTLGITGTTGWSTPNNISGVGNIIGEFTITAGAGNMSPTLNSVTLQAAGSLIQSSTRETFGLYDAAAPSVLLASSSATSTATTTFYFASTTASQWVIPFSSSKTLLVKTLLAPTGAALGSNITGGSTDSYQILLTGATWTDGPSTNGVATSADTTSSIGLSPTISTPVPSTNITNLTN
jgi:hypothetical protein